jgi:hypothetical protein
VQTILSAQSRFVETRLIGEFEDPEWIVLPHGKEEETQS